MHFFKVTSGRVSPSELPDSPCQSPPLSRKSSAAPPRSSLPPPICFPKAPTTTSNTTMKAASISSTAAAALAGVKAPATTTGTTTAQCTTTADVCSASEEAINHTNEEHLDGDDQVGSEDDEDHNTNVKRYNDEGTTPAVNSERNSFVSSDDLSLSEDDDTKVNLELIHSLLK